MKLIIDFLDDNEKKFGKKRAYFDDENSFSWREIRALAFRVADFILETVEVDAPVALRMKKSPAAVACFLGVALTGKPYVFIDENLPESRLEEILNLIKPSIILREESLSSIFSREIEENFIRKKAKSLDGETDLYISFTSSTTGQPKGVLTSYASVYHYVSELVSTLPFDSDSVMANQAPFHFDAYLKDVYSALFTGGSTYLVKKEHFLSPNSFIKKLEEKGVNTLTWTASAYRILLGFQAEFSEEFKNRVRLITFGSEVMRTDVLEYLRATFLRARIFQLYGTTETTGMTAYYEVKRNFALGEKLPLGKSFKGMRLFLHNNEIVISGKGLAKGYYQNPELTNQVFKKIDGERAYFTGDLGVESEEGILFLGRKNRVIKRAGYMLSLDDLEGILASFYGIEAAAALFDEEAEKIRVFYTGSLSQQEIRKKLEVRLPRMVLPSTIKKVNEIPRLANGKIDYRGLMKWMS